MKKLLKSVGILFLACIFMIAYKNSLPWYFYCLVVATMLCNFFEGLLSAGGKADE